MRFTITVCQLLVRAKQDKDGRCTHNKNPKTVTGLVSASHSDSWAERTLVKSGSRGTAAQRWLATDAIQNQNNPVTTPISGQMLWKLNRANWVHEMRIMESSAPLCTLLAGCTTHAIKVHRPEFTQHDVQSHRHYEGAATCDHVGLILIGNNVIITRAFLVSDPSGMRQGPRSLVFFPVPTYHNFRKTNTFTTQLGPRTLALTRNK